jgi:hypothetical protein
MRYGGRGRGAGAGRGMGRGMMRGGFQAMPYGTGAAPYASYYPQAMPGYPATGYSPYYGRGLGYPY